MCLFEQTAYRKYGSFIGMPSDIAHLEDLLDLFQKIDTLSRSAVRLREQVRLQMLAAQALEAAVVGAPSTVQTLPPRQRRKPSVN